MMRPPCAFGLALLFLVAAAVMPSDPADAQTRLPWADANPLERLSGKPAKAPPARPSPSKPAVAAANAAVPAIAAVPLPAARPEEAPALPEGGAKDDAGRDEKVGADPEPRVPLAEPRAKGEPVAQSRALVNTPDNGQRDDAAPSSGEAARSTRSTSEESGAAEAKTEEEQPIIPADPSETAKTPIADIPVPEERPISSTDAPTSETAAPSLDPGGDGSKATGEPADAPNSTERLKARVPTIDPAAAVLAAAAVADAEICEAELKRRGVAFAVDDSIAEGECGVLRPVNVTRLSSGISVAPKTEMLCRTALALDDWMKDGVVPAARAAFAEDQIQEFRHASTYVCRPRASESGISEHARGSAIDIDRFVFKSGKVIGIAAQPQGSPEAAFQAKMRDAACGPFKTVLGPGTDADHATHFHLDIAARKNGATYCK